MKERSHGKKIVRVEEGTKGGRNEKSSARKRKRGSDAIEVQGSKRNRIDGAWDSKKGCETE
jgi:hypothetical protein